MNENVNVRSSGRLARRLNSRRLSLIESTNDEFNIVAYIELANFAFIKAAILIR